MSVLLSKNDFIVIQKHSDFSRVIERQFFATNVHNMLNWKNASTYGTVLKFEENSLSITLITNLSILVYWVIFEKKIICETILLKIAHII